MGIVRRRSGGAWVNAVVRKRTSGAWVNAGAIVRSGGAWQTGTPTTFNAGETTILTTADGGSPGTVDAAPFTLTVPATPVSVSLYVATAAGQVYMGIYDATGPNSGPGNLKATTAVFTTAAGWNTKPVTTPAALPAGNYHVAFTQSSASLVTRKDPGGINRWQTRPSFGPLPAVYPTSVNSSPNKISLYATFSTTASPPSNTPTITGITPNPAPAGPVTVNGTNFTAGSTVSFGGAPATGVTVVSATQITCTAPAHADGAVSVTVTTSAGTSSGFTFTYQASAPPTNGPSPAYYAQWSHGPSTSDTWFPFASFLLDATLPSVVGGYPNLAAAQAAAGFNCVTGVSNSWVDPSNPGTADYWAAIRSAGMRVAPEQVALPWLTSHPGDNDLIFGWWLQDEADMQRTGPGAGTQYSAAWARAQYASIKSNDSTRPIFQNFGAAFATGNTSFKLNDAGGFDTGSQDGDMQMYAQAADIVEVDSYWYTSRYNDTHGAYRYGWNVDNTRMYLTDPKKPIWGFVETVGVDDVMPDITADQMEAAIWACIVHGARGMCYFNKDTGGHSSGNDDYGIWSTSSNNPSLAMSKINRLTAVNARLKGLSPVLNSPQLGTIIGGFAGRGPDGIPPQYGSGSEDPRGLVTVATTNGIPVDVMVRKYGGKTYVFAQASGNNNNILSGATTATFTLAAGGSGTVAVRDESRNVTMTNGVWSDTFTPYRMHIYVI